MKYLALTVLTLLIACAAFAGGNPGVATYIDFDPPNRLHYVTPALYTAVVAYICFGDLPMGLAGCSFRVTDVGVECPGVFAPDPGFTNLLPGDLAIGNYLTGITLASTECMPGPDVCVAYVSLFYLGGECCVEVLDHPDYPRWVLDCNDPAQVDFYGILAGGGGAVNTASPCPTVPVEESTWGSVKALYR